MASSFWGVKEVIERRGLFSSLYTDRGSHYWHTPEAGGKIYEANLTQFERVKRAAGHRDDPGLFTRGARPL